MNVRPLVTLGSRFQAPINLVALLAVGSFAVWFYSPSAYYSRILAVIGLSIIVATGLNVLTGMTGQLSLGQAGFYAVGAYTTALLTVQHGWGVLATIPVAAAICGLLGLALAAPALRLKGPYLAMVTIAFGLIIHDIAVEFPDITEGPAGLFPIPPISIFGHTFTLTDLNYLILAVAALSVYTATSLVRSRWGRALRAVHGNELAAASQGIPVVRAKLLAFVFSAVLAGIAGSLYATVNGFVNPDPFTLELSILFLVMVILGGAGTIWGPVVGAIAITLIDRRVSELADYRLLVYAGILLGALFLVPKGIVGALNDLGRRLRIRPTLPPATPATFRPAAAAEGNGHILTVDNVTREFSGLRAVNEVSLAVRTGSVHAIVGPNGAGKTTLLNLISGVDRPTHGAVTFSGGRIDGRPIHEIAGRGLTRTFQNLALFVDLSAIENVQVGLHLHSRTNVSRALLRTPLVYREERQLEAEALGLLEFVGLGDAALSRAGDLPQGHQRLLEVARALAARPRLLLLDEPAAGLNATEVEELSELVRRVEAAGVSVLFIEHHMDMVMSLSHRVSVLDYGQLIAEGTPAEVQANTRVIEAYLGSAGQPPEPPTTNGTGMEVADAQR